MGHETNSLFDLNPVIKPLGGGDGENVHAKQRAKPKRKRRAGKAKAPPVNWVSDEELTA